MNSNLYAILIKQAPTPIGSICFSLHNFDIYTASNSAESVVVEWANGAQCFRISIGKSSATFTHSNPSRGTLRSKISLDQWTGPTNFNVFLSWSNEKISFALEIGENNAVFGQTDTPNFYLISATDNKIHQVGDEGLEIRSFEMSIDGKIVFEDFSKKYWSENLSSVKTLINAGKCNDDKSNNSFFNAAIRQIISGFERYIKGRIAEIEREGYRVNLTNFEKFFSDNQKSKYSKYQVKSSKHMIERCYFIYDRMKNVRFSVNNLKDIRKLLLGTVGIDLYDLEISQRDVQFLERCFKHRHNLTHNNPLAVCYEYDGNFEFFFEEGTERAENLFEKLVQSFHTKSMELPPRDSK